MFQKVLIANRGEIALRVIRACKELGLRTVAVHSTADRESLHVRFADESICIGPPAARESYLSIPAILSAAEVTGADAIHPGYGFLSENAGFAEVCAACGVHFIGPKPAMIKLMGNKVSARVAMSQAGLPLLPGSKETLKDEGEAEGLAREIGFPVILKAAAGGGGRGMKIVREAGGLVQAFRTGTAEALAAFGNGEMYIERYVEEPRHIEFQVVADEYGKVVTFGERECSVQRRHQKLLEESPSPMMTPALRAKMGEVVRGAMEKVGYNNVGTIEFLVDEKGQFYFMEMNTRIQVEHPVTEQVTGIDLVQEQIRLASGDPLNRAQEDITLTGHAIECRINAEDPVSFAPSPGLITAYHPPGGMGVRVDGMAYEQYRVVPHYDSLIAKLICFSTDRARTIKKAQRALGEYVVEGIKTNIPFQLRILDEKRFQDGHYDTRIVEQILQRQPGAPKAAKSGA